MQRPLSEWLDENIAGWRELNDAQLSNAMRPFWANGSFRKLTAHTRGSDAEPVKVSSGYFAYIVL